MILVMMLMAMRMAMAMAMAMMMLVMMMAAALVVMVVSCFVAGVLLTAMSAGRRPAKKRRRAPRGLAAVTALRSHHAPGPSGVDRCSDLIVGVRLRLRTKKQIRAKKGLRMLCSKVGVVPTLCLSLPLSTSTNTAEHAREVVDEHHLPPNPAKARGTIRKEQRPCGVGLREECKAEQAVGVPLPGRTSQEVADEQFGKAAVRLGKIQLP